MSLYLGALVYDTVLSGLFYPEVGTSTGLRNFVNYLHVIADPSGRAV